MSEGVGQREGLNTFVGRNHLDLGAESLEGRRGGASRMQSDVSSLTLQWGRVHPATPGQQVRQILLFNQE